jgi:hypothetical protein
MVIGRTDSIYLPETFSKKSLTNFPESVILNAPTSSESFLKMRRKVVIPETKNINYPEVVRGFYCRDNNIQMDYDNDILWKLMNIHNLRRLFKRLSKK